MIKEATFSKCRTSYSFMVQKHLQSVGIIRLFVNNHIRKWRNTHFCYLHCQHTSKHKRRSQSTKRPSECGWDICAKSEETEDICWQNKHAISVKERMTLVLHQKQQQTSTTSEMFQQQPSPSYVSQFHHRNQTFIQAFSLSLKQKPYHNIWGINPITLQLIQNLFSRTIICNLQKKGQTDRKNCLKNSWGIWQRNTFCSCTNQ